MPRKIGVFARNREFILQMLDEGWTFRQIVNLLKGGGIVTSHQNLHKAYMRDLKKQEQCAEPEAVGTQTLESYVRSHHPKIFKEWLAFRRAATKQMPPEGSIATEKVDLAAVDRLWESVNVFKKLGRDELTAWVRDASTNSAARKNIFQHISRLLEKEYTDGNLSPTRYGIVKGWIKLVFSHSPETALEIVNNNAGKSFEAWSKSFESAMKSITEKGH